jgi:hypothetical protein
VTLGYWGVMNLHRSVHASCSATLHLSSKYQESIHDSSVTIKENCAWVSSHVRGNIAAYEELSWAAQSPQHWRREWLFFLNHSKLCPKSKALFKSQCQAFWEQGKLWWFFKQGTFYRLLDLSFSALITNFKLVSFS